jgi:predicted dithiol-disulfide oxidoreductase (DUF899 family)
VCREDWLAERKALLARVKQMTRQFDALRAERRNLPWVKIDKPYVFDGADGRKTLADHFCDGCAFVSLAMFDRYPTHARAVLPNRRSNNDRLH